MKRWNNFLGLCLAFFLLLPGAGVKAQDGQTPRPVYIVQEGDSLWSIALRFGVLPQDLQAANQIADVNQLAVGDQIAIPGLEGIKGVLTTQKVGFGETLPSLSRRLGVAPEVLVRLNRLTSPMELYAGANVILPVQDALATGIGRATLRPGQTLLELAALNGTSVWSLVDANGLTGLWSIAPGQVLFTAGADDATGTGPGALPDAIKEVLVEPLPLVQGKAAIIKIKGPAEMELSGSIQEHTLQFFQPQGETGAVALQGIHVMSEPGLYPLLLSGKLPDGTEFTFSQSVFVRGGDYPYDPSLSVSPETIDPAVTKPEDAEWMALAATFSPERLWDGIFQNPMPPEFSDCFPSRFGNRRSYNGSEYRYFHTGLDFCGGVGTPIRAPADGVVVFAGPLTVRGNATMIDHGWGVYTGYMHQSEVQVQAGETVKAGQLIGLVGATGRVSGPHLHWEIFVAGVQIDPYDWLQEAFP